jgi:hypothetical protein
VTRFIGADRSGGPWAIGVSADVWLGAEETVGDGPEACSVAVRLEF